MAIGDEIRITQNGFTADGKHRLNNGAVYQVKGFTKTGDFKLSNGWVIDKKYGNLAHGYCQTSHVAQSKTVDSVFVAQSSASSGAHQLTVYTNVPACWSLQHWTEVLGTERLTWAMLDRLTAFTFRKPTEKAMPG